MKFKAFAVAGLLLAVGCNTGSRSARKEYYGPGSTGATPPAGTPGSTSGGATAGGGTAGTFSAAPDLNAGRARHTATVMNDGRVLVVNGTDGQGLLPTTEVFDPTANAWTDVQSLAPTQNDAFMIDPTGQFATARQDHTATALLDGRILIVGGFGVERMNGQQPIPEMLAGCYTFNPQTNSFTRVTPLNANRGWHNAALLSNGSVLVAAGLDQTFSTTLKTADVYDPNQNTWTAITPGTSGEHALGSMLTVVNQTIIVGGVNLTGGQQGLQIAGFPGQTVEVFNVQSSTFQGGAQNVGDRLSMGAATNTSGNGFFAGGLGLDPQQNALVTVDTTETYDAGSQQFRAGPAMSVARSDCQVSEISTSSDMLIIGGVDGSGAPTAVCEVYGVLNNIMLGTVNMQVERVDHRSVTLRDGRILVTGGFDANNTALTSCEFHTR